MYWKGSFSMILIPFLSDVVQEIPIAPEGGTIVSGAVMDQTTNQPVRGAAVRLYLEGRPALRIETGEAGEFRFQTDVHTGQGTLEVWAQGFLPTGQRFSMLCADASTEGEVCTQTIDQYLDSSEALFRPSAGTCRLQGTVSDTDGRPHRGARVSLEGRPEVVQTDEAGRFSMEEVSAGLHLARAASIGMLSQERLVLVSCQEDGPASLANFRLNLARIMFTAEASVYPDP
jgi:hypothetical protein